MWVEWDEGKELMHDAQGSIKQWSKSDSELNPPKTIFIYVCVYVLIKICSYIFKFAYIGAGQIVYETLHNQIYSSWFNELKSNKF